MSLLTCNFFSKALMRTVPIQVVLPTDKMVFPGSPPQEEKPLKTLYLLHGIFGNYTDWVTGTRVQALAQDKNLAVIMPSGDNSFYVDNPKTSANYSRFIGEDLVDFTRRSFPLSRQREDTYIGGLSMGGFGSIVNALARPETFGAVCAFSSALILEKAKSPLEYTDFLMTNKGYYESTFGDLTQLEGSDKDYFAMAARNVEEKKPLPKFYLSCGQQDDLIHENHRFRDHLHGLGYDITWEEWPGGHDWIFWDTSIEKALAWLPLGETVAGVSSGNVTPK